MHSALTVWGSNNPLTAAWVSQIVVMTWSGISRVDITTDFTLHTLIALHEYSLVPWSWSSLHPEIFSVSSTKRNLSFFPLLEGLAVGAPKIIYM